MKHDFSGYATRANVRCSDGRTILPDAFKANDGAKVPLVWQHGHNSPDNVLGHAKLENREDGVYAYGFFNDTEGAANARAAVEHGDIDSLSIYANNLVERHNNVAHGNIREVSLVLSGANPQARIDNVTISHADGYNEELDNEAVITGGELLHEEGGDSSSSSNSDSGSSSSSSSSDDDETIKDVLETFDEKQLNVLYYMIGEAAKNGESGDGENNSEGGDSSSSSGDSSASHSNNSEGASMTHNVFESGNSNTLSHSTMEKMTTDVNKVIAGAKEYGTLKAALEANQESILKHAANENTDYGINNLELLFPDAKNLDNKPEFIKRQTEWVNDVLSGTSKRPFSRIKTMTADITHEEARARGYVRGNMKKEEFFAIAGRETAPTTIYKKQKLDRDDIIDVTTVDIVAWLWAEMRLMLNEEIARAILVGDGRDVESEDKIDESKIRPIVKDDDFYSHKVNLPASVYEDGLQLVDEIFRARKAYKGAGSPKLYTTEANITDLLLLRDKDGKRHFDSKDALARAMNVSGIVEIDDAMFYGTDLLGIIVNLADYAVGTDRGGEITSFDDFDIDYNQYKYLLEGRMSGSLLKPKAAVVLRKSAGSTVTESSPLVNPAPTSDPTRPETGTETGVVGTGGTDTTDTTDTTV